MAKTVANLNIQIGATTATLKRDLANAQGAVRRFGSSAKVAARDVRSLSTASRGLGRVGAAIATHAKSMLAVAAAATAATVSVRGLANAFTRIDEIAKLADRIGATTESIVGLRQAAELSGASTGSLGKSLERMLRSVGEAKAGTGEAKGAFERLGLSLEAMSTAIPAQTFGLIADSINGLATQSEKAAAADIFGRSGVELLNTLALGTAGLKKIQQEVDELGQSFSRVDAAKVEEANDAITRMKDAWEGLSTQLAIAVAPAVVKVAEAMSSLLQIIRDFQPALATFSNVGGFGLIGLFVAWSNGAADINAATSELGKIGRMVATELERINAEAARLSDEKIAAAAQAMKQAADEAERVKTAMKEAKKSTEEWAAVGDRIRESVKTPFEKLKENIAEVREALTRGFILPDTAGKSIRKLIGDFDKLDEAKTAFASPVFVGAATRGTAAGFSAVREGQNALKTLAESTKRRISGETGFSKASMAG